MKVGIISDVHANLPALDAVLNDLQCTDRIIHAGDIVGYNAFPSEVIKKFQDNSIDSIVGNHDKKLLGDDSFDFHGPAEEVINWTSSNLSRNDIHFMAELPVSSRFQIDGFTIQLVHGSPYNTNEYIYPTDLTLGLVEDLDEEVDILIWGHTHYSIVTKLNDVLLLNPGSVGQPRDGDWRSSYAIFDTQTGDIELRRTSYKIDCAIKKAKAESFPRQIIESLPQPN